MKRAFCIIVMALLAFATLGSVSFAEVSNPNTECGDDPKYNKYQIGDDGSVGSLETNVGTVVTLSANNAAERTYDYANTDTDTWTVFRIVLKHGQTENGVINDPAQSGTVDAESDISHITFCLKAAEAPPTTGGGETDKPDEGGSQETGGTVDNPTGGNTSVLGSTETQPGTTVLGENQTRPAAQAAPQAQAAMLAATGLQNPGLALVAVGLLLLGAGILRFTPSRRTV